MKFVRASKGPATRQEAWACLMANLALPGAGSLAAGRTVGYYQLAVGVVGLILTVVAVVHSAQWLLGNWTAINQPNADPIEALSNLWIEIRWPLAGLAIFAVSLFWSIITGMQVLSAYPKNPPVSRV